MPKRDPKRKVRTLLSDAEEKSKYQKRAGMLHSDPNVTASVELADEKDKWDARTGKLERDTMGPVDMPHPRQYGNHSFRNDGSEDLPPPQPKPAASESAKPPQPKSAVSEGVKPPQPKPAIAQAAATLLSHAMSTPHQMSKPRGMSTEEDGETAPDNENEPVKKTGNKSAAKTLLSKDTDKNVISAPAKAAVKAAKQSYSGFGEEDRTAGRRIKGNEEYDTEENKKKKK